MLAVHRVYGLAGGIHGFYGGSGIGDEARAGDDGDYVANAIAGHESLFRVHGRILHRVHVLSVVGFGGT